MTAIASYYAQVGVGIDRNSLTQVQTYLDTIQKKMEAFQKKAVVSKDISLRINNFSVNSKNLRAAINNAVGGANIRLNNVTVGAVKVNRAEMRRSISSAFGSANAAQLAGASFTLRGVQVRDFQVSRSSLLRAMNAALRATNNSPASSIRLSNFSVSQRALVAAINNALNVSGRTTRIRVGALFSQASLTEMRNQIRQSINQLVVSPTINPRINPNVRQTRRTQGGAAGGSGDRITTRNPRNQNPWHNPMMIGGGAGAFLRYGMYSLPFVAGAYGLNALTNRSTELEGQAIMMRAAIQDREEAARQEQYINQLGDRLGIRTASLTPFYAQMYAGARGTSLEPALPQGFSDFMDYASVMGLNEEQLKGSIRAISQMVSKGRIQSEELRQQLAEQGMPEAITIMAEVAAGGDRAKLDKMMEMGELDAIKYLPMFFEALGKRAQPFIEDFYQTVEYHRRKAAKKNEDWLKRFMAAGATEGLTSIFDAFTQSVEASIPMADLLGDAFRRAGHLVAAALLVPKETLEWLTGKAHENNFMNALFGDVNATDIPLIIYEIQKTIDRLKESVDQAGFSFKLISLESTKKEFEALGKVMLQVLYYMQDYGAVYANLATGNLKGAYASQLIGVDRQEARKQAGEAAQREGLSLVEQRLLEDDIFGQLQSARGDYFNLPMSDLMTMVTKATVDNFAGRSNRSRIVQDIVDNPPGSSFDVPRDRVTSGAVSSILSSDILSQSDLGVGQMPSPDEAASGVTSGLVKWILNNPWFRDGWGNVPENTPMGESSASQHRSVDINIKGTVRVEGEVENLTPDVDLSEAIKSVIEEEIGQTITQYPQVPK